MSIEIKSFNQILGSMVRKIVAETPLSDVNPGSVFLSLLEACASQDFDNNVAILNILELLNVDAIRNVDLDNKAADLGLERFAAVPSTGAVQFRNSLITKQSALLYSLKPAPISGQTVLFVNSTTGWASSGSVYIGRGTNSFEGPIPYSSITVFPTYSQINLSTALQKDHLLSDVVVNGQGQPDRVISAGTVIKVPANNQNPDILFTTIRDAIIPAGEDSVDGVLVVAQVPGSQGNAPINTIRQFETAPFTGAAVTNLVAFSTGSDIETDTQLRNRIKSHSASLARGTSPAILSAVINLSDPDENKRVVSATLSQPISANEPAILYIDDGNGFQPSQAGQNLDVLLSRANGTEEFLQLANYPLPRAQVVNTVSGPFVFADQMFLRVAIDRVEETVVFTSSDFSNITVATLPEIVSAINAQATLFKARLTDDSQHILIYPVDPDAEFIQVVPKRDDDVESLYANNVLNFPVNENSYIFLYQNGVRLQQREQRATVETLPFGLWNLFFVGNLVVSVDGTPEQDRAFSLADFPDTASLTTLSLDNWVTAFNDKFAGITATATPNQTMQISSNKSGLGASIQIVGGTYAEQLFGSNSTFATGQTSQFQINRSNGQLRLLTEIEPNDVISAGIADAKGAVISTPTSSGLYDLSDDDSGRKSEMVICPDSTYCDVISVNLTLDESLIISQNGPFRRILASNVDTFNNVQPGDFLYVTYRGPGSWVNVANSGLFKVATRGPNYTPGVDTYIDIWNIAVVNETVTVADIADITAFRTDGYPQVWTSSYISNPASTTLNDLVESVHAATVGVRASIFQTNSVKITSNTETNGSIAIPVSVGRISAIYAPTESVKLNDIPLIANKTSSKDLLGFIKFKQPIVSQNTYLDRAVYSTVVDGINPSVAPDAYPYSGTYSEQVTGANGVFTSTNVNLSDVATIIRGSNEGLVRSIKAKPTSTSIGTQQGLPRSALDHMENDEFQIFNSLQMSQDDSFTVIVDQDPVTKTISVPFARTGQINANFVPSSTEFSANDTDNEPGIDFSVTNVWGTSVNGTNFNDYNVLMRARNWYSSGGTGASLGKLIVRSTEYGANGNKCRFSIEYPASPDLDNSTTFADTPSWNKLSYFFGSGPARNIGFAAGTIVTVSGPYPDTTTNFPAGAASTGKYYDLAFGAGTFTSVQINDVLSVSDPGLVGLSGQYGIKNKSGSTIRLYAPTLSAGSLTSTSDDLLTIFPLTQTAVSDIVTAINASNIMTAAAVSLSAALITSSTFEDQYSYVSDATALAYGHNPTNSALQGFIQLYDGAASIKTFSNADPNFTLKVPLVLSSSGVSAAIYRMDTAPNEDSTTGEYFKLVPSTTANVHHHLTQKALSQLPIVADVSISDANKRVQVVSKNMGSNGAIEVLGGQANLAQTNILGASSVSSDVSGSYLLGTISAFPNSYSTGDVVKIANQYGAPRATQFGISCSIDVEAMASDRAEYYLNPVETNFTSATTIAITDVSGSYGAAANTVWRWTHSAAGTETLGRAKVGHQVIAFNCPGWKNTNQAKKPGDNVTVGFPIVAVNSVSNTVDVLNPFGAAMAATAIGTGTVSICPVFQNRWHLAHQAPIGIRSLSRSSNVLTVETMTSHHFNTGDSVVIRDSLSGLVDTNYGPITVTGPQTFTVINGGSNFTELEVGATTQIHPSSTTTYRLQRLGVNNLVRIDHVLGPSPRFVDCGVAVDDYLVLQGNTFNTSNNGIHRVVAVDNKSVIFEHQNSVATRNNVTPFNNNSIAVTWTANSNIVQGAAGAFKYVDTFQSVKKAADDDSQYVQVTGCEGGNFATATYITLSQVYTGTTGSALGVGFRMESDYDIGVPLRSTDDLMFFDGDSSLEGDTLSVQDLTNEDWFSPENTGQFEIIEIGNHTTDHRPFARVVNRLAISETDISNFDVAPDGFYVIESDLYKYYTYRTISNSTISGTNNLRRNLYMLPDTRAYKIAETNGSIVQHTGKLGYDLLPAVGTDGYVFYTGLLRRAQRTIDGYAPDPITYTERRAVGSRIEILPPLIKNITLVLSIATHQGATIQDVSNNVKSSIIDYINGLGVGEHVILSAIIAEVMKVKGVAAVTFNTPAPTEERITVASNEKALIFADSIGII